MLQDNTIEMHSTHSGKLLLLNNLSEFIPQFYIYMTSISKNVNIDKLDHIIGKCNTYHSLSMLRQAHILTLTLKIMIKILNF